MLLPPDPPAGRDALDIGLLNLLPEAARPAGERRFAGQLRAAGPPLRLHRMTLPSTQSGRVRRPDAAGALTGLPDHPLDGLIVTGAEPAAGDLADEAFWPDLVAAIDWARMHTRSTIFSCLAAHAAVRHLDGAPRRRLATKCFGLFPVTPTDPAGHAGLVSHSRWHDVAEADLASAGYTILGRMPGAVDSFEKHVGGSRFLFLQGHPEYGAGTLGREYRRDVGRFLAGAGGRYPALPVNYYAPRAEAELERFRAATGHARAALPAFPAVAPQRGAGRAGAAVFGDWLRALELDR